MKRHTSKIISLLFFILSFSENVLAIQSGKGADSTLNLSIESEDLDIYGVDMEQYMNRNDIKDIIFHDSLLTIGISAFQNCQNLTELVFPKFCEDIQDSSFSGCESLRKIKWPDALNSIGKSAFKGCKNLTDIVIPDGCMYILDEAFEDCDGLKLVEVPASVTYIGMWAIPINVRMIVHKRSAAEQYARKFGITYAYGRGEKDVVNYEEEKGSITLDLTQPSDHVDIYAVGYCKYSCRNDIKNIKFSDSLYSIGVAAFSECRNLESVKIPKGCVDIQSYAFSCCTSLKRIEIPSSVTTIGIDAFPLDATLIVERGSYAERYARDNGIYFEYKNGENTGTQIKNVIEPILKTHWDQPQPLAYFYGKKGKYGPYKWDKDGICDIIAYGQVLNHLGLNVFGSHRYATINNEYFGDFDKNKVDMNKIPTCIGYNVSANNEFYKYIENIALVFEHSWRKELVKEKMPKSKEMHIPAKFKYHYMNMEGKVGLEKVIRENLKNNIPVYATLDSDDVGHAVVIDGIREKNGKTEVHMNFGWGGFSDRWTTLQSIIEIKNFKGEIDYRTTGVNCIVEIIPLNKQELKEWQPLRME